MLGRNKYITFTNYFIILIKTGCHSINSVLFQGLAIGPDNYEMSKRLAEATLTLTQELARPGMVFYDEVNQKYFAFKMTITVDKKEANQLTVTGGGIYLAKFPDVYTDESSETKGLKTWRMCNHCFLKGNIRYLFICIIVSSFYTLS
jgi:hypothetical protein